MISASSGPPGDHPSAQRLEGESRANALGRMMVALAIAIAAAWIAGRMAAHPMVTTDFEFYWRAVRLWVDGRDTYAMRPHIPDWPLASRLYYPLPALILMWPMHGLAQPYAAALFVGLPAGLLAWRLAQHALWPLFLFATPCFALAAVFGQWSPWLALGMVWPLFGVFFSSKPTLGLACFVARPSKLAVFGCALIGLASVAIWPTWPLAWLRNLDSVSEHPAPLFTSSGAVLSLALLRWRLREARLLLAMAAVPQLLLFADQLPLMLVARTRREAGLLAMASWIVGATWFGRHFAKVGAVSAAAPYVLLGCYLPALWIVLRRPNEGAAPPLIERSVRGLPMWLRGRSERACSVDSDA